MEKVLPYPAVEVSARRVSSRRLWHIVALAILTFFALQASFFLNSSSPSSHVNVPIHAERILSQCQSLTATPAPPVGFARRTHLDRFVPGTPPTLITNARIWTGGESGREEFKGDVLLDKGIIKGAGRIDHQLLREYREKELVEIDADGAWVTPGYASLCARQIYCHTNVTLQYRRPALPSWRGFFSRLERGV